MSILFVGEHLTDAEEKTRAPFSGYRRSILSSLCSQVGIDFSSCEQLVALPYTPRETSFFVKEKAFGIPGIEKVSESGYIASRFSSHIDELNSAVAAINPNVIVACGNIALAALSGRSNMKKYRGSFIQTQTGHKVIATWSPDHIMRQYPAKFITLFDLDKARRNSDFPEIRRVKRHVLVDPTIGEVFDFYDRYIRPAERLSIDIETHGSTITEVGISTSPDRAIVIPFYSRRVKSGNYWPTLAEELAAWQIVREACTTKPSFGQNFKYDMVYLWRAMGIPCPKFEGDTMLLHHTLQPEMEKSLGFLASLYTDEPNWKFMRHDNAKQGD